MKNRAEIYFQYAKSALVVLAVTVLVRSTVVQAYHVTSGSMEDTIMTGDVVLADKFTYGTQIPDRLPLFDYKLPSFRMPGLRNPASGDLVIVESPEDVEKDLFKRVVAGAGQVVEVRNKQLLIDGHPFEDAPGVKHIDRQILAGPFVPRDNFGPYTVPDDHIFVMGDNRDNSYDSRYFGPIPVANVKAHPRFIYYSRDASEPIWHLADAIRWGRLGSVQ